jgi:hypothetical protein
MTKRLRDFDAELWLVSVRALIKSFGPLGLRIRPHAINTFLAASQTSFGRDNLDKIGDTVLRETTHAHNITPGALLGPSKPYRVQRARVALFQALKDIGWSYTMIGTFTGRHWTTIRDALKRRKRDGGKSSAKRTQRRAEAREATTTEGAPQDRRGAPLPVPQRSKARR